MTLAALLTEILCGPDRVTDRVLAEWESEALSDPLNLQERAGHEQRSAHG